MGSAEGMAKAHEGSSPNRLRHALWIRLVLAGATPALHNAALLGNMGAVDALLQGRADVNGTCTSRWHGMSALHFACMQGHAAVARRLLDAGADADSTRDQNAFLITPARPRNSWLRAGPAGAAPDSPAQLHHSPASSMETSNEIFIFVGLSASCQC